MVDLILAHNSKKLLRSWRFYWLKMIISSISTYWANKIANFLTIFSSFLNKNFPEFQNRISAKTRHFWGPILTASKRSDSGLASMGNYFGPILYMKVPKSQKWGSKNLKIALTRPNGDKKARNCHSWKLDIFDIWDSWTYFLTKNQHFCQYFWPCLDYCSKILLRSWRFYWLI